MADNLIDYDTLLSINRWYDRITQERENIDLEEDLTVEKAADTKLYVVEGDYDTDLEGMIFAVCTARELAEKAKSLLFDGEDIRITEMIADSIRTDDKILNVKDMQEDLEEIEME